MEVPLMVPSVHFQTEDSARKEAKKRRLQPGPAAAIGSVTSGANNIRVDQDRPAQSSALFIALGTGCTRLLVSRTPAGRAQTRRSAAPAVVAEFSLSCLCTDVSSFLHR